MAERSEAETHIEVRRSDGNGAAPRANVNRDSCLGQIKLQGSTAHEHIDELFHA